ncbi:MAG: L-threonylcarbamoyladenylate synthase [bacterium]
MVSDQITTAAKVIKHGGVVAYPTESCFGLGCAAGNTLGIKRILTLKKRSRDKGLILISDCFARLTHYIEPLPLEKLEIMLESWPGPVTWLCPAKPSTSPWLTGKFNTLAIRVTAHPTAARLCRAAGAALVSTSANIATRPSIRHSEMVKKVFQNKLDYVVEGSIGSRCKPSCIVDALSGEVIRS